MRNRVKTLKNPKVDKEYYDVNSNTATAPRFLADCPQCLCMGMANPSCLFCSIHVWLSCVSGFLLCLQADGVDLLHLFLAAVESVVGD